MARIRSLVMPVEIRPAGRLSKCSHNKKHAIPKGDTRFVVANASGMGEKGYCATCGYAMLDFAEDKIRELRRELEG
jgi:hypothetical protein